MPPSTAEFRARAVTCLATLACVAAAATASSAQTPEPRVRVGGLGSVAWGATNEYPYLGGTDRGEFNNAQYAVLLTSAVSDRMTTAALVDLSLRGESHDVDFSYAFVSWRIKPSLELRLGRVKHPGMLYSEVFDVGTVRPFLTLPPAIYGETGHAFENYTGAGLHGYLYPGSWQVDFSVFGGGGLYRYQSAVVDAELGDDRADHPVPLREMVGARVRVRPPIAGLSVGASAARGFAHPSYSIEQLFRSSALQLEYVSSRYWLRAEAATLGANTAFRFRSHASYVEAAAFLTSAWQLALLADHVHDDISTSTLPPSLQRHDGRALGLNYWINPNFVVKASAHDARGNRLAWPRHGDLLAAVMAGTLQPRTRLLQVGAQYSF